MRNECLARRERRQQQVEHLVRLLTMLRDDRQPYTIGSGPVGQFKGITFPDMPPPGLNAWPNFQLGEKKRRQHVAHDIAGANIHPGVLVHLSSEKHAAVGTFLTNDLGALDVGRIVDQQRTAFSATDVFCLVKTLYPKFAERSEPSAAILPKQAVSVVFNDCYAVIPGDVGDGIYFATDPRVVDKYHGLRFGRDQGLKAGFVEVECIRANFRE